MLTTTPWLEDIEGDYLPRLILDDSPVIRVVAGPGSGKTTGLRKRVERLILRDGVDPSKIFVGTFSRAVAAELRKALCDATPESGSGAANQDFGVRVLTLHSLAYSLLREYPHVCHDRRFRFLLQHEIDAMLYDIAGTIPQLKTHHDRSQRLRDLEAEWATGASLANDRFEGEVLRWLRRHQGIIIHEIVRLAKNAMEMGDIPQGIFDHVFVDEYQDLTATEQKLVELVWSGNGSLVVLGDDDQAIYSFRYNHPSGITGFTCNKVSQSIKDIPLPENWRCGPEIVNLANRMMAQAGSKKQPMVARRVGSSAVELVHWPTLEDEIDGIAHFVRKHTSGRVLILVPRRFIGYRLKSAIGEEARTRFHQEVLESDLVRERFTLAALLADPNDRVALRAWFGFKADKPEKAGQRNAEVYAGLLETGLSGRDLVEAIVRGDVVPRGQGQKNVKTRASQLLDLWNRNWPDVNALIDFLFDPQLVPDTGDTDKAEKLRADLAELREAGREIVQEAKKSSLVDVVDHLRYRVATRMPLVENTESRVEIMTLHGAKGLQADTVIIAGLADQTMAVTDTENPAEKERQLEEHRRLLYVAVTRARDHLVISWPRSMFWSDAVANMIPVNPLMEFQEGGARKVRLSACSLLPRVQSAVEGKQWLEALGSA